MAKRPPNPYTKYGRKRMRKEGYVPQTEEEREKVNEVATIYVVLIIVVVIALFALGGKEAVFKWMTR